MVKNSLVQPLYHNSAGACSIFMPWFLTGQRPCSELNIPVIDWGKSCSVFSSRLEVEANLQHLSFIAWYWEWAVPASSAFPLCVESSLTSVNGYREQEKPAFLQTSYFFVWLGHLVAFVTKLLHDCKINCWLQDMGNLLFCPLLSVLRCLIIYARIYFYLKPGF